MSVKVNRLEGGMASLYSAGKEIAYNGTSIEYSDNCQTVLIFRFDAETRCYVINGMKARDELMQVVGKVNIVCSYTGKEGHRFASFFDDIEKEKVIFYLPDIFFQEAKAILGGSRYRKWMMNLYDRYKEDFC